MEFYAEEGADGWYVYDGDDPQPVAGPLPEFMAKALAKEKNEKRYPRGSNEPPPSQEPEPDPKPGGSGGMGGLGF
ncbi:hypothetical protein FHT87_002422 [Rhizobium sp. BK316]|uniref:hypothetical protein n=1 Tax=Rhizobium sp. BK316 TaxID=2587053 RepID=UPI001613F433|nr:hypothetical protein [Rhizobium sp. BK316]MBB3408519.1 hypothetical protein [Rhizobium sp. BK316]